MVQLNETIITFRRKIVTPSRCRECVWYSAKRYRVYPRPSPLSQIFPLFLRQTGLATCFPSHVQYDKNQYFRLCKNRGCWLGAKRPLVQIQSARLFHFRTLRRKHRRVFCLRYCFTVNFHEPKSFDGWPLISTNSINHGPATGHSLDFSDVKVRSLADC